MSLVLVHGMPLVPHSCVSCGGGPQTTEGEVKDCIFVEAVDINWGDSVYICPTCVRVMAELYGFATPEDMEKKDKKIEELEEVQEQYKQLKKRVKRMLDGGRARKEVQKS